jgi:acetyl-CoA carboxylase carboxyl transferase subunit alpha
MNPNYLDFEQPIAELEMKIEELQGVGADADLNLGDEIERLRQKSTALTEKIYEDLSAWDIVRVARHPLRPYSLDYIPALFIWCILSPAKMLIASMRSFIIISSDSLVSSI